MRPTVLNILSNIMSDKEAVNCKTIFIQFISIRHRAFCMGRYNFHIPKFGMSIGHGLYQPKWCSSSGMNKDSVV